MSLHEQERTLASMRADMARRSNRNLRVGIAAPAVGVVAMVADLAIGTVFSILVAFLLVGTSTFIAVAAARRRTIEQEGLRRIEARDEAIVTSMRLAAYRPRVVVERDHKGEPVAAAGVTPAGRPFAIEHEGDDIALVEALTEMGFDGTVILDAMHAAHHLPHLGAGGPHTS